MPKSYIKSEPGAMRAFLNHFNPMKQVYNRLQSLTLTGHNPEKIEMIVLGGSRDVYPEEYKVEFVKGLYDACNTFNELVIAPHLTKGGRSVATGGSNNSKLSTSPTPPYEGGK
jgi:elongator complex protein 3